MVHLRTEIAKFTTNFEGDYSQISRAFDSPTWRKQIKMYVSSSIEMEFYAITW